ncbi:hypothetical protein Dimus_026223 [Dionaea muscipula]
MPSFSLPNNVLSRFTAKPKKPTKRPCIVQSLLDLCSQGQLYQAVNQLYLLRKKGLRLNSKTIAFLLRQCANTRSLKEGKWVHLHLKLTGRKDPGMLKPARKLFDNMPEKDVVSWNTMVIGYAQSGNYDEALRFYRRFRQEPVGLTAFSFSGILMVGVRLKDVELTRQVHCQVFVAGYQPNVVLWSSILDAYAKCGEMGDAQKVFDEMSVPDNCTWTALISGFARWGDMGSAKELFDWMPNKNSIAWTSLISGYARNGLGHHALQTFRKMMLLCFTPDQFTFSSCLTACAIIPSLKQGKQVHAHLILSGFRPNMIVVSSLIDMYSKCGLLEYCKRVFVLAYNKQDVMLWNPMISALAQHGYGEEAVHLFNEMVMWGIKPNRVSFVVILNACSHSGLLEKGLAFFRSMTDEHGILPDVEHYACLTDLLGRAGHFDELMHELGKMPCKSDRRIWSALVGVCSIHGNEELGSKAAHRIIEMDPQSSGAYLLLSSVYAASGNWVSVEKVRRLMHERCARKEQASSWIEMDNNGQALSS